VGRISPRNSIRLPLGVIFTSTADFKERETVKKTLLLAAKAGVERINKKAKTARILIPV
jgi:hypothetical protein